MRDEYCDNCAFFTGHSCRRFPPVAVHEKNPHHDLYEFAFWQPTTGPKDWCGEYRNEKTYARSIVMEKPSTAPL